MNGGPRPSITSNLATTEVHFVNSVSGSSEFNPLNLNKINMYYQHELDQFYHRFFRPF